MKINLKKIISVFLVSAVLTSFCPVISARNAVGETTLVNFNTSTPQTNLFWFEEYADAFVLLDDKDGKLLLMSENSWGETVFDESGSQKFDPEKNGNIAAWIKNNNPLPEEIKKYIVSSRWETEAGIVGGDCPEEYTIECKEALLSVTELEKYAGKLGIAEVSESGWWLRSPEGTKLNASDAMFCKPDGTVAKANVQDIYSVRPVFWIDKDFVRNIKLDVENMGTSVKKTLNKYFSKAELKSAGYTDMQINSIKSEIPGTSEFIEYIAPAADIGKINDINDNTFELKFTVSGAEPAIYKVEYTIDGKNLKTKTVSVSGSGEYEFEIPKKYGKHDINIKVFKGRKKIYDETKIITYVQDYEKQFMQDFWRKGFATHIGYGNIKELDFDYMEKAGIYFRRDEVPWNCMQYDREGYTYLPTWWYGNEELIERGHQNAAIAQAGNLYFMADGDVDGDAPHERWQLEGFAKYAHTMYTKKNAVFLEVWNEPNGRGFWKPEPNVEDYINLLKHTYSYVRTQDENIEIGSFVTAGTDMFFIENGLELGAYPYSTAIVFHPYIYPDLPANNGLLYNTLKKVDNLALEYGGWRDIAVTEVGWPTQYGGNTQQEQARAIIQNFVIGDHAGERYNFVYDLKNDGTSKLDGEHNFGIYEYDMTPKKSYAAVSAFNCELEGAIFHGAVDLGFGDANSAYLYSKDKKPVIITWMNKGKGEYDFGSGAVVKDMYGNIIDGGGKAALELDPVYITNLDDSWFGKCARENVSQKQNDWLKKYSGYFSSTNVKKISKIFDDGASGLKNETIKADDVKNIIDNCFSIAELVRDEFRTGKMDNEKMSSVLFELYKIAEQYTFYMMVLNNSGQNYAEEAGNALKSAEDLAEENHKKAGYTLVYADNILRYAKRHITEAQKVMQDIDNDAKAGIVPSQQKWTQKSFKKRNESYSFFCFRKTAAFIPRFA